MNLLDRNMVLPSRWMLFKSCKASLITRVKVVMALIDLIFLIEKGWVFLFILWSLNAWNLNCIHLLVSTMFLSRKRNTLLEMSLLTQFFNYGKEHLLLAALLAWLIRTSFMALKEDRAQLAGQTLLGLLKHSLLWTWHHMVGQGEELQGKIQLQM